MRRVTAILSVVAAIVLMAAGAVAQTMPNFAGEWKLMVARGQGEPGVDLTITQTPTAMTLLYRDGTKVSYALDGSKAKWAGNHLVVTTATSAGEEKRTLSMENGYLVVETSAPAPTGGTPKITKAAYQPYERGFGG